jgi:hypothetical protein
MNKKFLLKTILALQIIQGINTVANNQTTMERYESITYRLLSIELDLKNIDKTDKSYGSGSVKDGHQPSG